MTNDLGAIVGLDPPPKPSTGARDYWRGDAFRVLDLVLNYAESAQLHLEADDMGGVRRSLERLIVNARLAAAAVKRIEEIDAGSGAAP